MKAIGGYFELENEGVGVFPHKDGILLNTGRNALEYILRSLPDVKGLYLPYYTCEVVLEPIKKLGIPFAYYHINDCFEIVDDIQLEKGQYIIVNNYFGIKDAYIKTLVPKFGKRLIVDCAQAFFAPVLPNVKMFYSVRKYVGVPDGGVAYGVNDNGTKTLNLDDSISRIEHLKIRKEKGAEAGFKIYQKNEHKLDNQSIKIMSNYTCNVVSYIDYTSIIEIRRSNYQYLQETLESKNILSLPIINSFICPMVYPFMMNNDQNLRKTLIANKIFIACYWPNVIPYLDFKDEVQMAERILPLPIDQRYDRNDMDRILEIINS